MTEGSLCAGYNGLGLATADVLGTELEWVSEVGRGRLNPVFVEWMMMLPAGWVTGIVSSRAKALKCLGNGVVPPQAAYALRSLLARDVELVRWAS